MKLAMQLVLVVVLAAPALGNPLPAAPAGLKRWIVTFQPTVKRAGRDNALAKLNALAAAHIATDGNSNNEFSAAVVDLPIGQKLDPAQAAQLGEIVSIEEDRRLKWINSAGVSFQATPLPNLAGVMAGLKFPHKGAAAHSGTPMTGGFAAMRSEFTWGVLRVKAPGAWDVTEGAGVKVAVIDTGIDHNHPELLGKVDGGYNAIKKSENPEDYIDDNGHGTHVAGTIAAVRDGKGVVGVAPKARLYSVKVLDGDGSGNLSDVIDGIVWTAKNGIQVANMSLGAPVDSAAMHRAIRFANGSGVVIIAAAGNSGGTENPGVGFPGAYPETIAVSALKAAQPGSPEALAGFSSRGPQVQFIAPGEDIVSTKLGGGFVSYKGTSMAAPHVAGLAALAVSQGWVGLGGPDGVLAQLKKAAKPIAGLKAEEQGVGIIDANVLVR